MPNRQFNASGSRYGFNGKERDNEMHGNVGDSYDYGKRMYDPRLGRFLSLDPLSPRFPWYTPFQFAGNKPICAIDLDGMEEFIMIHYYDNSNNWTGSTLLYLAKQEDRKLGATGILEVNMNSSVQSKYNKKYKASDFQADFFTQNSDGTYSKVKGKYSTKSVNESFNNSSTILKQRTDQGRDDGVMNFEEGGDFIPIEYNKSNQPTGTGTSLINKLKTNLQKNPDYMVSIEGLASPENLTGDLNYNVKLAADRAKYVKDQLMNGGISEGSIKSTSSGDTKARAAGVTETSTDEAKAKYRGVDYKIQVKKNAAYD